MTSPLDLFSNWEYRHLAALGHKVGGPEVARRILNCKSANVTFGDGGIATIEVVPHRIDLDADPFIPDGWNVEGHKKGGQLEWDPAKLSFYLSEAQKSGSIGGHDLRKELANKPVLNANIGDYLLAHPDLIPDEWKVDEQVRTRYIFLWGTIYRYSDGHLYVRFLCFKNGEWDWYYYWLDYCWYVQFPALVLAS